MKYVHPTFADEDYTTIRVAAAKNNETIKAYCARVVIEQARKDAKDQPKKEKK